MATFKFGAIIVVTTRHLHVVNAQVNVAVDVSLKSRLFSFTNSSQRRREQQQLDAATDVFPKRLLWNIVTRAVKNSGKPNNSASFIEL